MLVRRHIARLIRNIIGKTVVADIHQNVEVVTTYRVKQCGLALTGAETCGLDRDQIAVLHIILCGRMITKLMTAVLAPFDQLLVHLVAKLFGTVKYDQTQTAHRHYFS